MAKPKAMAKPVAKPKAIPKKKSVENYKSFFKAYLANFEEISKRSQAKRGIPDTIVVCGDVVDAVHDVLAIGKDVARLEKTDNVQDIIKFMKKHLQKNELLTIGQDVGTNSDHWFSVIGDMPNIHIIEYLPPVCNFSETGNLDDFLDRTIDILYGNEPDRFYGVMKRHAFEIYAFKRKPLLARTVTEFLGEKKSPKSPKPLPKKPKKRVPVPLTFEEASIPSEPPRAFSRKTKKARMSFKRFFDEVVKNMEFDPNDKNTKQLLDDIWTDENPKVMQDTLAQSRIVAKAREKAEKEDEAHYESIKPSGKEYVGLQQGDEDLEMSLLSKSKPKPIPKPKPKTEKQLRNDYAVFRKNAIKEFSLNPTDADTNIMLIEMFNADLKKQPIPGLQTVTPLRRGLVDFSSLNPILEYQPPSPREMAIKLSNATVVSKGTRIPPISTTGSGVRKGLMFR